MKQSLFILSLIFLSPVFVEAQTAEPEKEVLMSDIPKLLESDPPVPLLSDIMPALQPASFNDSPVDMLRVIYYCQSDEDKDQMEYWLEEYYDDSSFDSLCAWAYKDWNNRNEKGEPEKNASLSQSNRTICRLELSKIIADREAQGDTCFNQSVIVGLKGRHRKVVIIGFF